MPAAPTDILDTLADFAVADAPLSPGSTRTAALCLLDALACAAGALQHPPLLLGPLFGGGGGEVRIPCTALTADPAKAAFDTSLLIRWLDFSDTSVLGGHPSDNLGAILAAAQASPAGPLTMAHVLRAIRTAYEIQGCLAANRLDSPETGLDQTFYVRLASTAVATRLLGGSRDQIRNALSNAVLDGQALAAYRHAPNLGPRKGWAGADASSRGVVLAAMAMRGEMGYPDPLGAPVWGFEAVHLAGRRLTLGRAPGHYFLDRVIFKLVPCQRNGSTAVEAALRLHPWFTEHADKIERVEIETQDEAIRRIATVGPLPNPAARDHCLQYMVAIALLHGRLTADAYSDAAAADPRIDALRARMVVTENPGFTAAHHHPALQSCANAIRIVTTDGAASERIQIDHPIGDPIRRAESTALLHDKFRDLTAAIWDRRHQDALLDLLSNRPDHLAAMPVPDFLDAVTAPPRFKLHSKIL